MPEPRRKSTSENLSPVSAIIEETKEELTQEDRERVSDLLKRMGDYRFHVQRDDETLMAQLRNEGSKAARVILDRIKSGEISRDSLGSAPNLYRCIKWLEKCATSEEAQQVGELLRDDRISLDEDRSNKSNILKILSKIGTSKNADQLSYFSGKSFENGYENRLIVFDNHEAIEVIIAILERTENEEEKAKLQEAIVKINSNLVEHRMGPFSEERQQRPISELSQSEYPDYNDAFLARDYNDNKFEELESRIETIKRLRREVKKEKAIKEEPEDEEGKFLRRHYLEYREDHPSPLTPTLGIEIEIRERSYSLSGRPSVYEYEQVNKMGVPNEPDAASGVFREFSHKPVKYYHTLSREVQTLIEMRLINREYKKHSLHLTIGGVTSNPNNRGYGAFVLARALGSTCWSTRGKRILRPYATKKPSWTVKGDAGVKERDADELELGVDKGVEIRTFQLQSITGLDRMLRSAFLLGAALKAYQEELDRPPKSDQETILVKIWENFSNGCLVIFEKYNLSNPEWLWRNPNPAESQESEFVPFANLLEEALENPKSQGGKFVSEMRQLIIKTRSKVADVLYKKETPNV